MAEVMDRVGLGRDLLGQLVERLSGGEMQRVLLGLTLRTNTGSINSSRRRLANMA
jgi:ABC-type Mn2+/Zn2+ transport system ATPase subunit